MQLILVRHGRPHDPTEAMPVNPPLHADGHAQARRVAERLSAEGIERIVSSPLVRARATAEPLAAALGLAIEEREDLAEVDGSGARYINLDKLRAEGGEAWRQFLEDPVTFLGGDAEQFRRRVIDGFRALIADSPGQTVVAFTHGLPINAVLSHILDLPRITTFAPKFCSITRLIGRDLEGMTVLSINETGHFAPGEV